MKLIILYLRLLMVELVELYLPTAKLVQAKLTQWDY